MFSVSPGHIDPFVAEGQDVAVAIPLGWKGMPGGTHVNDVVGRRRFDPDAVDGRLLPVFRTIPRPPLVAQSGVRTSFVFSVTISAIVFGSK